MVAVAQMAQGHDAITKAHVRSLDVDFEASLLASDNRNTSIDPLLTARQKLAKRIQAGSIGAVHNMI